VTTSSRLGSGRADPGGWAADFDGEVIGERWRLGDGSSGAAPAWGVVWDADRGEVVAVEILDPARAGQFVPVGCLPRHPMRWGRSVPDAIERASTDGRLVYLAGVIQAMGEKWIARFMGDAEAKTR
jgi:hypothetical protein